MEKKIGRLESGNFSEVEDLTKLFDENMASSQDSIRKKSEDVEESDRKKRKKDKCKRGRKKIRPHNPIKTEIMDKFWFRGFREFMKINYFDIRMYLDDEDVIFLHNFLSANGIPNKKGPYLSYSKAYKASLFSSKVFSKYFIAWAWFFSLMKCYKKFKGNWELYCHYLFTELVENCRQSVSNEDLINANAIMTFVYNKKLNGHL